MRWFAMIAVFACAVASGTDLRIHDARADAHEHQTLTAATPGHPARDNRQVTWLIVAQRTNGQLPENRVAVTTPDANYRYDPQGRRDPFESLVKDTAKILEPTPFIDPIRPRGPLERFNMEALKLVGILRGKLGRRGLIRAPDNKGYFVTVGMYMGQNGGQVIAIEADRLVVEEKFKDAEGNIVGKTLTLLLRKKEND